MLMLFLNIEMNRQNKKMFHLDSLILFFNSTNKIIIMSFFVRIIDNFQSL